VAVYQTEIKDGDKSLVTIPAGCYLKVQDVKGDWILATVARDGKNIAGWVYAKHVQAFADDQRSANAANQSSVPKTAARAAARQLITAEMIDAQYISNDEEKVMAYIGIASDQASAGDVNGARVTAELIIDPSKRATAYLAIANRQVHMGDSAGALQTLELAKLAAEQFRDDFIYSEDYVRASMLRLIVRAQADAGDLAAAKATTAQIGDQVNQSQAYFVIAETQMKDGDWAGAEATAALISDEFLRFWAHDEIIAVEARSGGVSAVFKFIDAATRNPRESCELLRTAAEQLLRTVTSGEF
jgi:hypothetical protein